MMRRGPASGRALQAREFYDGYMQSPEWFERRRAWYLHASESGEVMCLGCRQKWTLNDDLHHIDYDRIGAENYDDLWPLCRTCHDGIHEILSTFRQFRRMPRRYANTLALGILHGGSGRDHVTAAFDAL